MGPQLTSYSLYLGVGLTALVWALVLIPKWSASAQRRGGLWYLEAILLACGPVTASFIAMYPRGGEAFSGPFPVANRYLGYVTTALVVWAIIDGLKRPRKHAGPVIVAVLLFYFALLLSVFGGAVPSSIPETYWVTPLVVLAFLVNGKYTFDWLLLASRFTLRLMMVLSLASMALLPEVAFNPDELRTVFGIGRLQGITEHPNTLAALAVVGLLLELSARSRLIWKLPFVAAIVLAQSDTSYVMVLIGALLVTTWASKIVRALLLPAFIVVCFLALSDFGLVQSFVASILPDTTGTLNGRTRIWEAALFGFQQSPIFGYGPAFLSEDYRAIYLPNFAAAAHAHSQWYQSLGGTGLIGVATLLILVTVLVVFALKSWRATRGVTVAILAAMVIRSLTETPLRPTGVSVSTYLLVLTLAIIATAPRKQEQPAEAGELPQAASYRLGKATHVPGVPAAVQTHPVGLPTAGAELTARSPAT